MKTMSFHQQRGVELSGTRSVEADPPPAAVREALSATPINWLTCVWEGDTLWIGDPKRYKSIDVKRYPDLFLITQTPARGAGYAGLLLSGHGGSVPIVECHRFAQREVDLIRTVAKKVAALLEREFVKKDMGPDI